MKLRLIHALIFLALTSFAAGCSVFESEPSAPEEEAAAPAEGAEAEPAAAQPKPSGASMVEVFWQVPTEAVEKYHLYYGLDPDSLTNHVEVAVTELEKIDHPKLGPVFRYEIKPIPANQPIYLSLQAENKAGRLSDRTHPARVEVER